MPRNKNKLEELAPNVGEPVGPFIEEFVVKPNFDHEGKQSTSAIGSDGKEYCDPTPLAAPIGAGPPNDVLDMIKAMIDRHRHQAMDDEFDSPEDMEDFDIEDDPMDPLTPYEKHFEPPAKTADKPPEVPLKSEPPPAASPAATEPLAPAAKE